MSSPTWQDITPLPQSILSYFGGDPDYSPAQIEAAYRLLQHDAEQLADDPVLCRRTDITGADVLAVLEAAEPEGPHASDCPVWVNEPCVCEIGKGYRGEDE